MVIEDPDRKMLDELIFTGIEFSDLWLEKEEDDLIISIIGTNNFIVVKDYARFRINLDTSGVVVNAIENSLVNFTPIKSLKFSALTLSINSIEELLEVMSAYEKPLLKNWVPAEWQQVYPQTSEVPSLDQRTQYAPSLESQVHHMEEDGVLVGKFTATDRNPDDVLTYEIFEGPSTGNLELNSVTGEFLYIPEAEYFGEANAVIRVMDSTGRVSFASLAIAIIFVDDPPLIY